MGQAKTKLERLKADHPFCCFCGGMAPTETIDHVPNRASFVGRHSPRDYVFPACKACNSGTSGSEELVTFLALISPKTDDYEEERLRLLGRGLRRKYPEMMKSILPTSNEKRRTLRQSEIEWWRGGVLSDVPLIKLEKEFWNEHLYTFGVKLGCALHYKHTGTIISLEGGVHVRIRTNAEITPDCFPTEILEHMPNMASPQSPQTTVSEQFRYRFGLMGDKSAGIFLISFQDFIFYALTTLATKEIVGKVGKSGLFPPLKNGAIIWPKNGLDQV